MPRPITPPDLKDINFSVKLSPEDMKYLDETKTAWGKTAIADVVREAVLAMRTLYSLPAYQAERLRQDMQARNLNLIQYVQELLARRYEELAKEPPPAPPKGKR